MAELTKVFLNTWHHYNEGCIGFGWMTTDEARAFMESKEGITEFEEWFIADIDNYLGLDFKDINYSNVDEILDTIETLEGLADWERDNVIALMEYNNIEVTEAIEKLDNYIFYADIDEYHDSCDELIENRNLDDLLCRYFDYDAYHRDCDFDIYEASNGVCILG